MALYTAANGEESRRVTAEIICDGVHVHPGTVNLAIRAKSLDGVMAITDGTAAAALPAGSEARLGGRRIVAGGRSDRIALGTGGCEILLVGGNRGVGFRLQAGRFVEVLCDAVMARLEDAADARNDDLRHEKVEKTESDRQPQELRCERGLVERREHAGTGFLTVGNTGFGVHFACRLSRMRVRRGLMRGRRSFRLGDFEGGGLGRCQGHRHADLQGALSEYVRNVRWTTALSGHGPVLSRY